MFCNTFVCSCRRRYLLLPCSEMIDATCSVNFFNYFFNFLQKSLGVCALLNWSFPMKQRPVPMQSYLLHAQAFSLQRKSSCDTLWTYKCIFPTGGCENPSIISWPSRQKTVTFLKKKRFRPDCCSCHVATT